MNSNSGNGRGFGRQGNSSNGRGFGAGAVKGMYNRFSQAPRHQQILSIVVTLLVLVLVVYIIVRLVNSYKSYHARNIKVIPGTVRMNNMIKIDGDQLPRSNDQRYGIEFSYAGWMYIDSLNAAVHDDQGNHFRHVFHKGTGNINTKGNIANGSIGAVQAPGVWLDSQSNVLNIVMNTFPSNNNDGKVFENCQIQNVPMKTWFHLAIVCINKNIDVFINGKLKKREALDGVPRLNYGNLYVGGDSYDGYMSNMYYFAHALQIFELDRLVAEGPAAVMFKTPDYDEAQLSQDWYLTTKWPTSS